MKSDCDLNASSKEIATTIARYRASGLGLRAFAREARLPPGRLHYWVYQKKPPAPAARPRARPAPTAVAPVFQEVKLPARPQWGGSWAAEVGLPGDIAVRFGTDASPEWIGAVVQALQRPC